MKKVVILVCLLLFYTSLCSAAEPEKLTVILDWIPNTTHAPLIIAQQQGFFKEAGLNVQLIHPTKPSDPSHFVAQNKADIGVSYEPKLIEHIDHGLPIIRIGTLIDKPLDCVIALKDSGIKTLIDLKGKEIGSAKNSTTNAVILTSMLQKQGLVNKDIKVVNIRSNLAKALLSNKVEAISGTMRNLEVPMLEASGHKLVVFFPEEHGIPNYSELVFIANIARVHDPRFPRFLAAVKKAIRYLDEHPQQAWETFTKQYPHLNTALNREYWFATIAYFAEDPAQFNHNEWKLFANFMQKNKLISKTQPISRYTITIG